MNGVGVDVDGVGVSMALSVHELVQHGWNISHARLRRSPRRCQTARGVIVVALTWLV